MARRVHRSQRSGGVRGPMFRFVSPLLSLSFNPLMTFLKRHRSQRRDQRGAGHLARNSGAEPGNRVDQARWDIRHGKR